MTRVLSQSRGDQRELLVGSTPTLPESGESYLLIDSGAYILEANHTSKAVTDTPDRGGRAELTGFEPVHENLRNKCRQGFVSSRSPGCENNTRYIYSYVLRAESGLETPKWCYFYSASRVPQYPTEHSGTCNFNTGTRRFVNPFSTAVPFWAQNPWN